MMMRHPNKFFISQIQEEKEALAKYITQTTENKIILPINNRKRSFQSLALLTRGEDKIEKTSKNNLSIITVALQVIIGIEIDKNHLSEGMMSALKFEIRVKLLMWKD